MMKDLIDKLNKIEEKSTCSSKRVGCIFFDKDYNCLAYGYNKSIINKNCKEIFKKGKLFKYFKFLNVWVIDLKNRHKKWSLTYEIHAEENAINNLLKERIDIGKIKGCLVTYSPCENCLKSLIDLGIKEIYYLNNFDNIKEAKDICKLTSVDLIKIGGDYDE